jgi:hypothetical protein
MAVALAQAFVALLRSSLSFFPSLLSSFWIELRDPTSYKITLPVLPVLFAADAPAA